MLRKRAFQEGQFAARAPWLDGRSWAGEDEDETAVALSGEEAGEGLFEDEDEGVVYVGEDELEDAPLVPGTRILDFTSRSPKEHRRGNRDPAKVFALVLHQMACCYKRKSPDRYLAVKSHFAILRDGTILQLHPTRAMIWTSNGISKGSVAVEFAGNFPNTKGKWWSGKKMGENRVQPAQIEAGRYLVEHLIRTMGLRIILAHRQSSDTRENDPGPDIWYHVGQWAVEKHGLGDGGPGFKVGSGKAIPDEWRTWGASGAHPLREAEGGDEREAESPSERTDKAYVRWVQEALNKILGTSLATDGKIGPKTRSAVRSFQEQTSWMGLSATGTVDKLTELALWMRGGGTAPALGAPAAAPSPAPAPSPGGGAAPVLFPAASPGNLRLVPFENPGGGRIQDKTPPPASALVTIDRVGGGTRPLRREAADAWRALVAAARADGLAHPLLLVTSGFRDPVQQQALWDKALARYGSAQAARKWVAPPGSSPHQSGRAIDFYLGGKNDSANVGNLRKLPAYQWMVANAVRFGFYPYQNEPWHWEYNPPAGGSQPETEAEEEVDRGSRDYGRWLQKGLNQYLGAGLTVDGKVGTKTRSAIRAFQEKAWFFHITPSGDVDALTEVALIALGGQGLPPGMLPSPAAGGAGGTPSPAPASVAGPVWGKGPVSGATLQAIREARARIADVPGLADTTYKGTAGLKYYSCLSDDGKAFCEIERRFSAHMDAPRTDGTRETARGIVWTELAREGDANSINTYDSQGMTWGRGFAAGGTLHRMIWLLFSLVPGLRAQFNAIGLDGDGKKVYIVDDRTGEVLSGKEGFRRHRRDRRIASFLIQKGKEHPDELLRAELDTLASAGGAVDVPDFALRWDKQVLQFVGHCVHWYSSLFAWKRWEPTGGDFREVLGVFVKRLVEHTERGNFDEEQYRKFGHGRRVGAAFILDGEQACRYVFGDRNWRSLVDGYFGPPGPLPVFPSGILVGIPAKDARTKSYLPADQWQYRQLLT